MNKTHVPDFSITSRQFHNCQVTLRFCVGRGSGWSSRSSAKMSARRSARSSVGTRNVVRFFPVAPEKCELALGNHKTWWIILYTIIKHELYVPYVNHTVLSWNSSKRSFKRWKTHIYIRQKCIITVIELIISRAQQLPRWGWRSFSLKVICMVTEEICIYLKVQFFSS